MRAYNATPELGSTFDVASDRTAHLDVRDLRVTYRASTEAVYALRDVSFSLPRGEVLGIVGESGSGKTSLAMALMGLLPNADVRGHVRLGGDEYAAGDEAAVASKRWGRIALAFQTSGSAFDPVYTIFDQVAEPIPTVLGLGRRESRAQAREALVSVGLAPDRFERYPHELSGGEKQRAMLAMATACHPEVLIVDEPTSGLDVLTRTAILALLRGLQDKHSMSLIVISHDLGDVTGLARRTVVLYGGTIVEQGETGLVLEDPRHPYSWGLVNAFPKMTRAKDLWGIRGEPPDPTNPPAGCPFAPRCTQALTRCHLEMPALLPHHGRLLSCHPGGLQTLLEARHLSKAFHRSGQPAVQAVRNVSLQVREGEVVAVVGQTGSGKSTLGRLLVGLMSPDQGDVLVEGQPVASGLRSDRCDLSHRVQMISQNPLDALSPRLTVEEIVREPLDIQHWGDSTTRREVTRAALVAVRLPITAQFLARRAHELSGGQLQRVAIARALVLEPKMIVADEPVSMLDASEQARVIRLLKDIQNERGVGLLLISHDIALVRKVADRIVVMREGEVVEEGMTHVVLTHPAHAYTRLLLEATTASTNYYVEEKRDE